MIRTLIYIGLWCLLACNSSEKTNKNQPHPADQVFQQAETKEKAGNYDQAVALLQQAADLYLTEAQKNPNSLLWEKYVTTLNKLGWDKAVYLGDYASAREHLNLAGEILEERLAKNHPQELRRRHNLAVISYYENKLDESIQINLELLALRKALEGDRRDKISATLNNLGLAYRAKGDLDQALGYFQNSLALKREFWGEGHQSLATSYQNIGNVLNQLGDVESAIDNLEKSYDLFTKYRTANHPDLGAVAYTLGKLLLDHGNLERAAPFIKQALRIQKAVFGEDHRHFAHSIWELARIQAEEGAFQQAQEGLEKALIVFQSSFEKGNYHISENLHYLAWVAWKKGDFRTSRIYLDKALKDLNMGISGFDSFFTAETKFRVMHGQIVVSYSQFLKTEDYQVLETALEWVNKALEASTGNRRKILSKSSQLRFAKRTREILDLGVEIAAKAFEYSNKKQHLELAFHYAEAGKMAVLQDAVRDVTLGQLGLEKSLFQQEQSLRDKGFQLNTHMEYQLKGKGSIDEELLDTYVVYQKKVRAFLQALKKDNPKYYELKYSGGTKTYQDVASFLKETDVSLLAFHLGRKHLTTFIAQKTELEMAQEAWLDTDLPSITNYHEMDWLKTGKEHSGVALLAQDIQNFRESMIFSKRDVFSVYGRRLFQILIADKVSKAKSQRWLIIPDGALAHLPFEALLQESPRPEMEWNMPFLIKEKAISYSYSAYLLTKPLQGDRKGKAFSAIGFAPEFHQPATPNGGQRATPRNDLSQSERFRSRKQIVNEPSAQEEGRLLKPLTYSRQEVLRIAELFEGFGLPFQTLLRERATKDAFLKHSHDAWLIHLATHAEVDAEFSTQSKLYFSSTEKPVQSLLLGEIYSLNLNAEIVVLSACETALGKIEKGEGIMGFVRGFHHAGARQLLVSLWQIDDEKTAAFMAAFYAHYGRTRITGASLRTAKLETIRQNQAPNSWAGFILSQKSLSPNH